MFHIIYDWLNFFYFCIFKKKVSEHYLSVDGDVRNMSGTKFPFEFTHPDNSIRFSRKRFGEISPSGNPHLSIPRFTSSTDTTHRFDPSLCQICVKTAFRRYQTVSVFR